MSSESKCPFHNGMIEHTTAGGKGNRDWWPDQLNLSILHQQSSLSNPMGERFNYAEEFKSLDLDALIDESMPRPAQGQLAIPNLPGIGCTPDPKVIERYRVG